MDDSMFAAIIVGVITGVIASWIAWWVLYHIGSPKIGISENIKKRRTQNRKSGYYYQFKFGNLKNSSDAVDISIGAKIYLPGVPKNGMTNIYNIPVDGKYQFELVPNSGNKPGWARQISLLLDDEDFNKIFDKTFFSTDLKEKAKNKLLILEDILSITPKAFIRIYISAMDSFTGSRKVFRSKDYYLSDIKYGSYERYSLDLVEDKE